MEPLTFGVESRVPHDHEKQVGEENASDASSDLSFQADQSPEGGKTSSEQLRSLKVLKSRCAINR